MRIDAAAVWSGERTMAYLAAGYDLDDLRRLTDGLIDEALGIVDGLPDGDVVFVPVDPDADDPGAAGEEAAMPWTIGHVVVHATAGSEEGAAAALTLARGAPLEGRPRYEVPWETVTTIGQVVHRLEESRRMRQAMLAAWPDEPHLDNAVVLVERLGPLNATGRYLLGLMHEEGHLPQLAEIARQARAARGT
ncbi:MAG: DinB family protein [Chloroflexota bacterium]|nr:DinB family protein [Chloroflexota bacterium]